MLLSLIVFFLAVAIGLFAGVLVLRVFGADRKRANNRVDPCVKVAVLIPAHREAQRIADKLRNTLALSADEVIVGVDGDLDETEAIAREFPVKVLASKKRQGKAAMLRELRNATDAEWLLFTDVSASLDSDAIGSLLAKAREGFDLVAPRYEASREGSGGDSYWRFSTACREAEALAGLQHSAHGAAYLVRASAIADDVPQSLVDDVEIPLSVAKRGGKLGYDSTTIVRETEPSTNEQIFWRAQRIIVGNLELLAREWRGIIGLERMPWRLRAGLVQRFARTLIAPSLLALTVCSVLSFPLLSMFTGLALLACWSTRAPALARRLGGLVGRVAFTLLGQLAGLVTIVFRRSPQWSVESELPWAVQTSKRAVDLLASTLGLVALTPVFVLVAAAIKLDSRGPVIYAQKRVRRTQRGLAEFSVYKFRSMRTDAEASSGPVWANAEDPRVTRVGRFLRKSRLDELPQLWNVLRGDMSLVGPRPERAHFVDLLAADIPGYLDRLTLAKPGITGLAQVNCGYDTSVDSVREKLLYDLAYSTALLRFRSFAKMEIRIMAETVRVMISGRGAQ